jgi:hypothetical protein
MINGVFSCVFIKISSLYLLLRACIGIRIDKDCFCHRWIMPKIKERLSALAAFWRKGRISWVLVALLVISVIFLGLHDVGMILGYLATTILMVELTRRWRKIRYFVILFFASFLGMILLAFLHEEVVSPLVSLFTGAAAVKSLGFRIFSDVVSLVMIFIGVMGIVIGIAGTLILGILRLVGLRNKRRTEDNT